MSAPTQEEIDCVLHYLANSETPTPPLLEKRNWVSLFTGGLTPKGEEYFKNSPSVILAAKAARIKKLQFNIQDHLKNFLNWVGDLTNPRNKLDLLQLSIQDLTEFCKITITLDWQLAKLQDEPYKESPLIQQVSQLVCQGPQATEFAYQITQLVASATKDDFWALLPQPIPHILLTVPHRIRISTSHREFYRDVFQFLPKEVAHTWAKANPTTFLDCFCATIKSPIEERGQLDEVIFAGRAITNPQHPTYRSIREVLLYGTSIETLALHYPRIQPLALSLLDKLHAFTLEDAQKQALCTEVETLFKQIAQTYLRGQIHSHRQDATTPAPKLQH